MSHPVPTGSLYETTLRLLREVPTLQVHKDTGLPFHWLKRLRENQIENPSVNRIQKLYEYLTGQPLKV